jgi:pSer/pThr/pTyr-binding forkhead associated (FHA) protein
MDVFSQLTQPAAQEEDPSQSQAITRIGWGQLKGFGKASRLLLLEPNKEYLLGRNAICNLTFENAQVSNRHCAIVRLDKDYPANESPSSVSNRPILPVLKEQKTPVKNDKESNGATVNEHDSNNGQGKGKEAATESSRGVERKKANGGAEGKPTIGEEKKWMERHPSADKALVLLYDYSSNGTYVNGKLIGKGKQVALKHKDMISLATKNAQIASPDLCMSHPHPNHLLNAILII